MTTYTKSRAGAGLVAAAVLAIVSAACSSGGAPVATAGPSASPGATAPSSLPSPSQGAPSTAPSRGPVSVGPSGSPAEGAVPAAIVAAAVNDVATRSGVAASAVTVVSADATMWPNGAAGCPQMGFLYTDVITPGYRVVLEVGGKTYDYRGSRKGASLAWCENARPVP